MSERPQIVCTRFSPADLEAVEIATRIMGDASVGAFVRAAAATMARAIIEAAADAGGRGPSDGWGSTWIEGSLEQKPSSPEAP